MGRLCKAWARAAALIASLVVCLTGPAVAQNAVEDFYRGKQVTLIVGYGPGGGYDITARLVARYLGKYIPDNPTVVVQNMPGAGSMRAANTLYVNAPKDGTTIGLIARDMPLMGLLGNNPNVQFDSRKFSWLGSSSSYANDAYVLVVGPKSAVKSMADARRPDTPPLVLGGTGEGATDGDVPKILRDTIGIRIKQVLGYTDTPASLTAAPSISPSSRRRDRNGSSRTAAIISWCSSPASRGIRICRTCQPPASSRSTPRRAS